MLERSMGYLPPPSRARIKALCGALLSFCFVRLRKRKRSRYRGSNSTTERIHHLDPHNNRGSQLLVDLNIPPRRHEQLSSSHACVSLL